MNKKFFKTIKLLTVPFLILTLIFGYQLSLKQKVKADNPNAIPNPKITGFLSGIGTYVNDVVFSSDGNKAYLSSRTFGLVVLDTTDKLNPKLYGQNSSQQPNSMANQLAVSGNTAIAGGSNSGTDIIDISNPGLPIVRSSVPGMSINAAIKDNYAYLCTGGVVKVVNISNLATPIESPSTINTAASGISIIDNYAVIAAGFNGVTIADITDPLNPVIKSTLDLGSVVRSNVTFYTNAVKVATGNIGGKNYAFVSNNGTGYMQVIDISNPVSPAKVGEYYPTASGLSNIIYKDNKVYLSTGTKGLYIISVSTPSVPSYVSKVNYGYSGSSIFGNYLYTANGSTGLSVLDITNPTIPIWKKNLSNSYMSNQLAVSGNVAIVTGSGNGADIVDISNPNLPKIASSVSGFSADAAIKDTYAYIASAGVVKVVDISNPATASVKATINTATTAYGVSIIDHYAVIAVWDGGVVVADIIDPLHPTIKTPLALGGGLAIKIATGNIGGKNYAFVANSGLGKLQVVDISNPDALVKVGEYSSGNAFNVIYKDNKVYLSAGPQGMHIVNVSTPSAPTLLGKSTINTSATDVLGNYAFLTSGGQDIIVTDISNPAIIRTIKNYPQFGNVADVLVSGNKLFAADANAEIIVNNIYGDDITISKTVSSTTVSSGTEITYTLIITNTSPNTLTNINIPDPIPANATYLVNSATVDGVAVTDVDDSDSYSLNLGTPTWTFATIPASGQAGSTKTLTFKVKAN